MVITCVVCGVDAGLRGAVLICVTAQSAADLVKYTDNIILRGQCHCRAGIQNGSREPGRPRAFLNGQFRLTWSIIQSISSRGVSAVAGRAGEIKIKRDHPRPGSGRQLYEETIYNSVLIVPKV